MHRFKLFTGLAGLFFIVSGCCSFVIPPVTLTGNKTAIEKQIIGEPNELEKDVWMVSSAKTTNRDTVTSSEEQKEDQKELQKQNQLVYQAFGLLEAFDDKLKNLKSDRVVGENNKGKLQNLLQVNSVQLPDEIKKKYDQALKDELIKGKPYRTLIETVEQVNKARDMLIEGYLVAKKRESKEYSGTRKDIALIQKQKFHEAALKGEYLQNDAGNWYQK